MKRPRSLQPTAASDAVPTEIPPRGYALLDPAGLAAAVWPIFAASEVEEFHVLLLDARSRVIRRELIARGSLDAVHVHPREVFCSAVRERAAGIVALHNHPSGDPEPGDEDVKITRRLILAGDIVGIPLVDHVVLAGPDRYVSMLERGVVAEQKPKRGAR